MDLNDATFPEAVVPDEVIAVEDNTNDVVVPEGKEVPDPTDVIAEMQADGQITPAEAKELKKTLKIKVDGEEFDESVDFNDEESLKRHLQKSKAFDKRVKEFSSYKSQVEQAMELLQKDPEAFMEKIGMNVDEFAEKRLSKKIEELRKSPEQLEAEKMKKRLEEYEAREKELEQKAKDAEMERHKNEQASAIENEITSALADSSSVLPKNNPQVYQRIAQMMFLAMKKGRVDVTPKDVIPYVEKQYQDELSSILSNAPDEILERFVTKEKLNNYRQNKVKNAKAPVVPAQPKIVATGTKASEPAKGEEFKLSSLLSPRRSK